jgi:flavocytochrome c
MKSLCFILIISIVIIGTKNLRDSYEEYDLVIIGGGLAGLTAAYESYLKTNNTIKILLIEQLSSLGGNSKRATSGINFLETDPQKKSKIDDNYHLFFKDTLKSGKNLNNPQLLDTFSKGKKYLYDYYTNIFGLDIKLVGQLGGHSVARTHRPTDSKFVIGYYLISKISKKMLETSHIKIYYNSTVTKLLKNETSNKIYGLKYKKDNTEYTLYCKAIILSSGGYGHDFGKHGLLNEYAPELMNFPSTNGDFSKGSGVKLGREIGADLVDMDKVQVHPTGFVDPKNRYVKDKFLAPELLRGVGGILVNENGDRFCDELGTRDYVTRKIKENCKKQDTDKIDQYECFLLMNEEMAVEFGNHFNYYKDFKGFILEHANFNEMSKNLSIDYKRIENTINMYNDAYDKKIVDKYNKTTFLHKFDLNKKIYSMVITPSVHYTMGGLKINNRSEVIDTNGKPINGLFGAGEVTGGVHGGNRLGGNSLAECGVFGRIAADSAVNYIAKNKNILNPGIIKKSSIFGSLGISSLLQMALAGMVGYNCYKTGGCFIGNNNFGNYYLL